MGVLYRIAVPSLVPVAYLGSLVVQPVSWLAGYLAGWQAGFLFGCTPQILKTSLSKSDHPLPRQMR